MNNKLIALAIAGALAAPLAAQADVTVYGNANVSYDNVKVGGNGNQTGVESNNSYFGVKGGQDLGNGLKGIFQIESGVNLSSKNGTNADANGANKTGTFASRNSFVGVESAYGTVRAGRFDSPYKDATRNGDAFADTIGDVSNVMGNVGGVNGDLFNTRVNNALGYNGSFAGVNVGLQMGTSEAAANSGNAKASVESGAVSYGFLGANVGAAYEKRNNVAGFSNQSVKGSKVFGDYTFANLNNLKVAAAYEEVKADSLPNNKQKNYSLQGSLPFAGNNAVNAEYAKAKVDGLNAGAKLEAVGVKHNFNPRTNVYAVYARVANDANGSFGLGANNADGSSLFNAAQGATTKALSVGLQTKF